LKRVAGCALKHQINPESAENSDFNQLVILTGFNWF
jgi:hypothetical protein